MYPTQLPWNPYGLAFLVAHCLFFSYAFYKVYADHRRQKRAEQRNREALRG